MQENSAGVGVLTVKEVGSVRHEGVLLSLPMLVPSAGDGPSTLSARLSRHP